MEYTCVCVHGICMCVYGVCMSARCVYTNPGVDMSLACLSVYYIYLHIFMYTPTLCIMHINTRTYAHTHTHTLYHAHKYPHTDAICLQYNTHIKLIMEGVCCVVCGRW
eukprot:GHVQ01029620.1.p2 GENE.GHVQ01029620.1~~GHVQ01029620.1.p2  ORF type:complete len:108 (+),score=12.04 GHVQ01029620.1:168-491(+)